VPVTLWDTDPAEVPRLRHVECEVRQDAEDTHAEVGGGQVGEAEVYDAAAHLAVQEDDGDDQNVT